MSKSNDLLKSHDALCHTFNTMVATARQAVEDLQSFIFRVKLAEEEAAQRAINKEDLPDKRVIALHHSRLVSGRVQITSPHLPDDFIVLAKDGTTAKKEAIEAVIRYLQEHTKFQCAVITPVESSRNMFQSFETWPVVPEYVIADLYARRPSFVLPDEEVVQPAPEPKQYGDDP